MSSILNSKHWNVFWQLISLSNVEDDLRKHKKHVTDDRIVNLLTMLRFGLAVNERDLPGTILGRTSLRHRDRYDSIFDPHFDRRKELWDQDKTLKKNIQSWLTRPASNVLEYRENEAQVMELSAVRATVKEQLAAVPKSNGVSMQETFAYPTLVQLEKRKLVKYDPVAKNHFLTKKGQHLYDRVGDNFATFRHRASLRQEITDHSMIEIFDFLKSLL